MKRRFAKRVPDPAKLTEDELEYLVWGCSLDPEPFDDKSPEGLAAARAVYQKHREEVIASARADKFLRHLAPWAWWAFESPGPKRQLSGPAPIQPVQRLYFGEPALWENQADADSAVFESDEDYLVRLHIDAVTLAVPR